MLRRLAPTKRTFTRAMSSIKPLYQFDETLPNLPVPTLEETAARYLKTLEPFHTATAPGAPNTLLPSFETSKQVVAQFVSDPVVKTLQERLIARAQERDSWLSEWWNETAYFGWRGPVVPGVNYFYLHKDNPAHKTSASRAASLIRSLLFFRRLVVNEELAPELARKQPLCMRSYKYLFNSSRIPTAPVDSTRVYDPATNNHIVVVRKNKFYHVPVVDGAGEFLSEPELEKLFSEVIKQAGTESDPNPLGSLTSANRDVWTKARQEIVSHSQANGLELEKIESAIIVVALDDTAPVTRSEASWGAWVGDGQNRFFDKHELIVFENGKSAFNGEHSAMDGTPTSRLNDFILRSISEGKVPPSTSDRALSELPHVTPIKIELPLTVDRAIKTSIEEHQAVMKKHSLSVLQYDGIGKNAIKAFNISPDSFTQLVMQLAFYRMKGELAPTYESAQTRKFKLGRTEVIRSATAEALEWCKSMDDAAKTDAERLALFQKAGKAHIQYATDAADGRGVDRHLFGLKKLLQEGEKVPALYQDPTYSRSNNWILSTSQLSSEFFDSWGYGEVVDEGYGLAYSVNERCLRFTVTSMNKAPEGVEQFCAYLHNAANDTRDVMERAVATTPKL